MLNIKRLTHHPARFIIGLAVAAGLSGAVYAATTADFNNDGKVDILDLSKLMSTWGMSNALTDLNGDGKVTILDLSKLLTQWGTVTSTSPSPEKAAYYVAPNGSDDNDGSLAKPFKTLTKARDMARANTKKTIYLRSGTYAQGTTKLEPMDSNQSWLPYPGETAIIDPGSGQDGFALYKTENVAIQGLSFRNVRYGIFLADTVSKSRIRWNDFKNCDLNCVAVVYFSNNNLVDSNTIEGGGSGKGDPYDRPTGGYHAAIYLSYSVTNNTISHNKIENYISAGISLADGTAKEISSNNTIDRNIIKNVNADQRDAGAIGIVDRAGTRVGTKITNNFIDGNGSTTSDNKAIYLDDNSSDTLIEGNTCRNCGRYAIQLHGSTNVTVKNNIFDLSSGARLGLYQNYADPAGEYPNKGMGGNSFTSNLTYSSGTVYPPLWDYDNSWRVPNTPIALPLDRQNLYWSASGQQPTNDSTVKDAAPIFANPRFADPGSGNYTMPADSPAYSQAGFKAQVTDRGPLARPSQLPQ